MAGFIVQTRMKKNGGYEAVYGLCMLDTFRCLFYSSCVQLFDYLGNLVGVYITFYVFIKLFS